MKSLGCVCSRLYNVEKNGHLYACSLLVPLNKPPHARNQQPPPNTTLQKNASWSRIKDILLLSSSAASLQEGIWQFIKKMVLFSTSSVFNIAPLPEQSPHWYFQLSFIGFVGTTGSTDDSREGNVRKSKPRWSAVPHRSLVFLYCLISQWPLSDFRVSSCLQVFCVCECRGWEEGFQTGAEQQRDWGSWWDDSRL